MPSDTPVLGKRVNLSFDFDSLSLWIGSYAANNLGPVSAGEFSPLGVTRILAMLAEQDVRATFFIPGHTAETYPDSVRAIDAGGHEIGAHGYVHERVADLKPEKERWIMEKGMTILEGITGKRPIGYRSPSADFTAETATILQEFGITYDSSLMGSDSVPYWLRNGDKFPNDAPYVFGDETGIVELPWHWMMDDFPHFGYIRGGGGPSSVKSAAQVYDVWWEEFDYFIRTVDNGCFNYVMHPDFTGRGPRVEMLSRLIDAMRERDAVFSTLEDAAAAARAWLPPQRLGSER